MIITVSREFGSGGREVGKRLADKLNLTYIDREIVTTIANENNMQEDVVEETLNQGVIPQIPLHYGRSFYYYQNLPNPQSHLLSRQQTLLKEFADRGNCIIVGRAADVILEDYDPFRIFVYADLSSKLERCRRLGPEEEALSDHDLERKMKRIDSDRARYYSLYGSNAWGDKSNYDLCINTSQFEIRDLVPIIADYIRQWYMVHK
ncbi:MAG: cytidylate kinase-like family protein [Lachnospiraceae bacterium]|nr:cytidylate kinase-like family protein [Lachnospiraceae bacterium]MBQ1609202.1 cytidylate kinase-like family protein [Lachnospiraceae bacterium]MBQ1641372.1 cytidylate kinase-like family protein [Lachnospiraceae bacterium]MBQ2318494.1 cytidylate kinase-like family protein [Lachnospiraceae bacterium]MBQ2466216.1 cytidylate kinase-like family protein [Lachnospiraceae bacterium]